MRLAAGQAGLRGPQAAFSARRGVLRGIATLAAFSSRTSRLFELYRSLQCRMQSRCWQHKRRSPARVQERITGITRNRAGALGRCGRARLLSAFLVGADPNYFFEGRGCSHSASGQHRGWPPSLPQLRFPTRPTRLNQRADLQPSRPVALSSVSIGRRNDAGCDTRTPTTRRSVRSERHGQVHFDRTLARGVSG